MIGSNNIRTCVGVPNISHFRGTDGTPIVINLLDDSAWYLGPNNIPRAIRPYELKVELAHVGMTITTDRTFILGTGWTRVVNYNSRAGQFNVGFDYDLVAGTLTPLGNSDILIGVNADFVFDEGNASRIFYGRLFDVTDGVPSSDIMRFSVGRNTSGFSIGQSIMASLVAGHEYALEFGGGDDFPNAHLFVSQFNIVSTIGIDLINVFVPVGRAFNNGFSAGFQ